LAAWKYLPRNKSYETGYAFDAWCVHKNIPSPAAADTGMACHLDSNKKSGIIEVYKEKIAFCYENMNEKLGVRSH